MGHIDDKEIRFDLRDTLTLSQESWYHFVGSWRPHHKLLPIVRVTKGVSVDECLTLIRDHVAFEIDVVITVDLGFDHDCDEFGNLETHRMVK